MDEAISHVLIDVAKSSAVDVLTKESVKPWVRGIGRTYKAFSLIEPATGFVNAVRIAAYGDAFGILAQEVIVHLVSKEIAKALVRINSVNFEITQKAEKYLLTPEFAAGLSPEKGPFSLSFYNPAFSGVPAQDYKSSGKLLFDQTIVSIERAMRSFTIVNELLEYPESSRSRRNYAWDRRNTWVHRVNETLGYALWRPVPEVGLGLMAVTTDATYRGIVRRDTPEGYGRIEWMTGGLYFGQVSEGWPVGYGVNLKPDGSIFVGRQAAAGFAPSLGALISSTKDSVYYGQYQDAKPWGYGRRIGLKNGMESVNGMWLGTTDVQSVETLAETYGKIARSIEGGEFTAALGARYRNMQRNAEDVLNEGDATILRTLKSFL